MENSNIYDQVLSDFSSTDYSILFIDKVYSSEALDFLTHSAKTLNYYKREGLLLERAKKSNFSFVELVWIRIVYELKNIGVKSELIEYLKNVLLEPIDSKAVTGMFKSKQIELEIKKTLKGLPEEDIADIISQAARLLKKGAFNSNLQMSKLFTCLSYTLQKKNPVEIRFYKDNEVGFYLRRNNLVLDQNLDTELSNFKSYISISVTDIISFYMGKVYINPVLKEAIFSEDEKLILSTIKKEKPKAITVEFTKDNKIDLIKVKHNKTVDISQRLSEIFLNGAYEDVTITTQKGKIVHCTKVKKIKPE